MTDKNYGKFLPLQSRAALIRVEKVLRKHRVPLDESTAYNQGERPKAKIDAIIRDVQCANAKAGE